jgi:tetratricopeptide (TPR) repeat protein
LLWEFNRVSPRNARLLEAFRSSGGGTDLSRFVQHVGQHYLPGSLLRLCEHRSAEVRRAAVLSLGWLGDTSSFTPLGQRLSDSDRRVRSLADESRRRLMLRDVPDELPRCLERLENLLKDGAPAAAQVLAEELLADRSSPGGWPRPLEAELWSQVALAQFQQGRTLAARRAVWEAVHRDPFCYTAWVGSGHIEWQLGQTRAAEVSWRRALFIFPDLEQVRLRLESCRRRGPAS